MANPFAPAQVNIAGGVQNLMQQYQRQRILAKAQELETARKTALQGLLQGGDPREAVTRLMGIGDLQGASTLATAIKAQQGPQLSPDAILAHQDRMTAMKAQYPWMNVGGGEPGQVTGGDTGMPPETTAPHPMSAGELAADKKYAAGDYIQFLQGAGLSETEHSLKALEHVKEQAEAKGSTISGPIIGAFVKKSLSGNEDASTVMARAYNTEAFNAAQGHQRAVVASLRPLVGARAAQQLFQSVLQTTYDPMAEPSENARRLGLIIDNIRQAAKAKQKMAEYFKANGTLSRYSGPTFDPETFDPTAGVVDATQTPPGAAPAPGASLGLPGMQTINTPPPEGSPELTATGPNGHKIVVRNGVWVDAQTGQPVQ